MSTLRFLQASCESCLAQKLGWPIWARTGATGMMMGHRWWPRLIILARGYYPASGIAATANLVGTTGSVTIFTQHIVVSVMLDSSVTTAKQMYATRSLVPTVARVWASETPTGVIVLQVSMAMEETAIPWGTFVPVPSTTVIWFTHNASAVAQADTIASVKLATLRTTEDRHVSS
eukprot:SAG31_NODE_4484_length_3196_cov_1.689377_2_plen_175_part_00